MLEKSIAVLVAAVCLVLLVRLALPERHRWRLDAEAQGAWRAFSAWAWRVWRWRSSRKAAAQMAEEAIRRARNSVERDGNVYRPKSFQEPRDPPKPH